MVYYGFYTCFLIYNRFYALVEKEKGISAKHLKENPHAQIGFYFYLYPSHRNISINLQVGIYFQSITFLFTGIRNLYLQKVTFF